MEASLEAALAQLPDTERFGAVLIVVSPHQEGLDVTLSCNLPDDKVTELLERILKARKQ